MKCSSSPSGHAAPRSHTGRRQGVSRFSRQLVGCIGAFLAFGLAACGSATATRRATTAACASTVADTLGEVGERIYHAAATGDDVTEAVDRVRSSLALASAIGGGDANGAGVALRTLLRGQIVRIEVIRDGHVLATAGTDTAIAPVRGSIPGTGASFVLSVQSDHAYLQVAHQITGAQILLLSDPASGTPGSAGGGGSGARRLAGTITGPPPASVPNSGPLNYAGQSYEVASLAGSTYPSGALRIALLVPSGDVSCPGSSSQTRVETLGSVGERIYKEETDSPSVFATLRRLESSSAFRDAVAARNVAATHRAIDGFFAAHIHVVRVRVTVGQHLLIDDGGPYVLAPVRGTLRSGGRVVGHFEMSIQDDAGYLKLAHLFTGAEVLMRTGGRQVEGTLNPGPTTVPSDQGSAGGVLTYGGHSYATYSFTAEAFPAGALRISLLIPS